jgi:D-3-phosphoglycerate dehydrogenase
LGSVSISGNFNGENDGALMKVAVWDGGYEAYDDEQAILGKDGHELVFFDGPVHDVAGRIAFSQSADGIFIRWTNLGAAELDALPNLKAVVRYGVGYDNIDVDAATARRVPVCNVQGYASHAVSDHALALIFACVRGLFLARGQMATHFTAPPRRPIADVKDLTLGIVGLGRIGSTLAMKAQGLFKDVVAYDPYVAPERFAALGARAMGLDALLGQSDVVSLHCNLTDETRQIIDGEALGTIKAGAIVINTARGPVVDEGALLEALNSGKVHAAGVDVFPEEPPPLEGNPILEHPHVVATGHYAWYSDASHVALQRRAALNMAAMLRGEWPEDCLNAGALKGAVS